MLTNSLQIFKGTQKAQLTFIEYFPAILTSSVFLYSTKQERLKVTGQMSSNQLEQSSGLASVCPLAVPCNTVPALFHLHALPSHDNCMHKSEFNCPFRLASWA